MQRCDFDGEYIAVVQEKTKVKILFYYPTRLRAYRKDLPKVGRHILAYNPTQPPEKRAVQRAVEDVREKIGPLDRPERLVIHGWR